MEVSGVASVDELLISCVLSKQVKINGECALCHDRLKTQDNIEMGDNESFSSSTKYRKNLRYCGSGGVWHNARRGGGTVTRYSDTLI